MFSHPDLTLKDLQEQATSKQGLGQPEDELGGITLRSIFWRIYLGTLDITHVLSSTPRALLRQGLKERRQRYDTLRRKWLISPDGRWANDCTFPDGIDECDGAPGAGTGPNVTWDPLNLGESVRMRCGLAVQRQELKNHHFHCPIFAESMADLV